MKSLFLSLLPLFCLVFLNGCEKSASNPIEPEPPLPPVQQAPTGLISFFDTDDITYSRLITMKPDSSEIKVLLNDAPSNGTLVFNEGAKWSFDKSKLVFTSNRDNGRYDLFSINSDGTGLKNLTNTSNKDESYPSISPNGQYLLYTTNDLYGKRQLFIANADGSNARQLTTLTHPTRSVRCLLGIWSHDGNTIYFQADKDTTYYNIYSIKADGTGLKRITTNDKTSDWLSSVAKTGKIAYYKSTPAGYRVFTVNEDGTSESQVTDFWSQEPAISPDGNYLAFISNKDKAGKNEVDVYMMKSDGTGLRRLTNTSGSKFYLDWK